ncbi:hypothetical protein OKJ48_43895 [Streptomyces kunmingensis]|uniref:Uncharacterized protein n=1 Tax=Streptomyces kunmingensis TaxID=68225 RepID=A0ABU6CR17_9ACTN|nr:hypothetical protein [Streptomyces kunmingensis]MEB3967132.1 hypothetical protein [Streptomyces kunmingensis]
MNSCRGFRGSAVSPGGRRGWITNEEADTVSVIDPTVPKVRTTLRTGHEPEGIAISPR